jgi:sec-independent protein translocase protein TatA
MGNLGSGEILVVAFVVLVLFGSKKLNGFARELGESNKELKKMKGEYEETMKGLEKDIKEILNEKVEDNSNDKTKADDKK